MMTLTVLGLEMYAEFSQSLNESDHFGDIAMDERIILK
jgi:hypothetical protein